MMADTFDQCMKSSGRRNADGWTPPVELYRSYVKFGGEKGIQTFSRRLERTLIKARKRRGRGWLGYELRRTG